LTPDLVEVSSVEDFLEDYKLDLENMLDDVMEEMIVQRTNAMKFNILLQEMKSECSNKEDQNQTEILNKLFELERKLSVNEKISVFDICSLGQAIQETLMSEEANQEQRCAIDEVQLKIPETKVQDVMKKVEVFEQPKKQLQEKTYAIEEKREKHNIDSIVSSG
jgi:hypothetical protein